MIGNYFEVLPLYLLSSRIVKLFHELSVWSKWALFANKIRYTQTFLHCFFNICLYLRLHRLYQLSMPHLYSVGAFRLKVIGYGLHVSRKIFLCTE